MNATAIGLDFTKDVFQIHSEDAEGEVVTPCMWRRPLCET